MDEPLIEVSRGSLIESRHTGSVAVMNDRGQMVFSWGDTKRAVYPRSAVKAIQALALVESGAADHFAYSNEDLAMACASHSGEAAHAERAAAILVRLGLSAAALECGAHWPMGEIASRIMARAQLEPSALHNNCSGKHCGFLALAVHRGYAPEGYVKADHPVQVEVRRALEEMVGVSLDADICGTDGCSIPTYAMPLGQVATAFARFGTGHGLSPERARACVRIRYACAVAPQMVAGTGRFCTDVMRLFGERVFVKTGAEGVFCGAFPDRGLGFALKIDDGATRASEAAAAALIASFVTMSDDEAGEFERFRRPRQRNWRGIETGGIQPGKAFEQALEAAATAIDA